MADYHLRSNRLIFKTYTKIGDDGYSGEDSWGFFGIANKEQRKYDIKQLEDSIKYQRDIINQYKADYKEAFNDDTNSKTYGNSDAAHKAAMANLTEIDDKLREYIDTNGQSADVADKWEQKQRDAFDSANKGALKFSNATKALIGNIGAELAIAFAIQAIGKAWDALNDRFQITPAKKIEAMETAVNDYNDALSESSDNIKTIESLEDEFNSLAKGVDDAGRNVSLSADEYERYNEIVNELVAMNPSLLEGYTAEGNAIVDRNNAIQDGIDKQKEYAEVARASYATIGTGDDIFAGSDANINKLQNKLRSNAEDIGRVFGDIQGDNIWKDSGILNSLTGYSIDFSSNKKSVDYLVDAYGSISDKSLRILQYTSQRKDLDEEDYTLVQSAIAENDALYKELLDYAQPRLEWLNAYVSTINEETGKSLMSEIPQDLQDAFQTGLKEIAYSAKDSADAINLTSKLRTELVSIYNSDQAAQGTDSAGNSLVGYQTALENAEKAKRQFDRSNKDDAAIETYNSTVLNSVSSIRELADAYEDTFPEISAVLDASANDIESYAKVNELSIKNAVNQFDDLIKAARGAKETFDNALADGDYYTGVEAYKEIYNTMFNGQNELGNGSLSFWQGAEQILGNDYLQEVQYDIDTVKAKLKGLSPLLEGGAHGAALLGEELANAAGGLDFGEEGHIKDEFGNIIADVKRLENGAVKFDIDKENFSAVADILNISEETLTALLDSARQFSNVDFSNTEEIRDAINKAAETNDGAIRGRDGNVYMDTSAYQQESGLSGTKLQDSINKLNEMGIIITGVNDDVEVLKSNFQNIASYNKDGTLNLAETVESYHAMGTSASDLVSILTKVGNVDLAKLGSDGYDSIQDYVEEVYKAYDLVEENPEMEVEVENTEAIKDLNDSLNEMIRLMGGSPPINIKVNGEGSLKNALDDIESLTDTERESIINIITQYNKNGDLNTLNQELNKILGSGNSDKKTLVMDAIVKMSGGNLDSLQGQLQEISKQSPNIKIADNTSTVISNIGKVSTKLNNIDGKTSHVYIKTHKSTIEEEDAVGTPGRRIFKANALGTIGRRIFGSVAKGNKGKLGSNGRGGLTLTGELGPELVYIPSESYSFMVGMSGPEMINLPGDAVVYTADETRRIVGDTISLPRPRFDSLVKDNKVYKYGSAGGGTDGTLPSIYTTSSSSSSSSSFSSSKKKSKKKTKVSISAYEKGKAKLDHQLEMGYISEKKYYEKLKALYNKHKKALKKKTEDYRQALEDQRQARIDAYEDEKATLDYKLEMGKISEAKYYKELDKLGKKYYMKNGKIRKGYLDEYRQWQQDKADAAADAYDKEQEALDKKLEDDLISLENYYKKSNNLRNKYLTGTANKEKRNEAKEDTLDRIRDQIEDDYNTLQDMIDDRESGVYDQLTNAERASLYGDMYQWAEGDELNQMLNLLQQYYDNGMLSEKDYYELRLDCLRDFNDEQKEVFEEHQDQLQTITDLVEDMLRQEAEDYITALEDQLDAYKDIIDAKKEALELTERELDFQDKLNDYAKDEAKLIAEINMLELDDSREAQAKKAELQQELAELQEERARELRDETIDRTTDKLDEQVDLYEEFINKYIEVVENWLNNKAAVLDTVAITIEQRETNNLLDRLIKYNGEHGDGMMSTVDEAVKTLDELVALYGDNIGNIVEVLQKGIDVNIKGGIISPDQTDYRDTQNETLFGQTHHSGLAAGFTGNGADLKQHEVYRLLTDDELVFNRKDQMRLANQLQILDTIKSTYSGMANSTNIQNIASPASVELTINAPINIEGNASADTVKQIQKALENTSNIAIDKINNALRINGIRTSASTNMRKS